MIGQLFLCFVFSLSGNTVERNHLDGCDSRLVALVAMNATGTVDGLLHGIVRQQAKDEWNLFS